jgi:hypothetical protein
MGASEWRVEPRRHFRHHRRQEAEGIPLPLDNVKNPVLPHARVQVVLMAVPLPKKAPAETLGGIPELLEAGLA